MIWGNEQGVVLYIQWNKEENSIYEWRQHLKICPLYIYIEENPKTTNPRITIINLIHF